MSNLFKSIGLIALMCFCFYLTDKTILVIKNNDELMIRINEEYSNFETKEISAIIDKDTIIPGICSKKVDKEKTYYEMSKIGEYNNNLYVYEYINPKVSLNNNIDKYIISDNKKSKKIYIFIELNNNNYKEILERKYKKYNFYTSDDFFLNNKNIINKLVTNNNSILMIKTNFSNLKKINSEYYDISTKNISCYFKEKNNEYINNCSLIKSKSIYTTKIINENYLLNLKKSITNGLFISVNYESFKKEKNIIEKYIKSKGYSLATIDYDIDEC